MTFGLEQRAVSANMSDDRYDRAVSRHLAGLEEKKRWTTTLSPPCSSPPAR